MAYASDNELNLAEELGYAIECSSRFGHRFCKGTRHVWTTYWNRRLAWQTADLIDGHYCNHVTFYDLTSALKREI